MPESFRSIESKVQLDQEDTVQMVGILHVAYSEYLYDKQLEPQRCDPALTWFAPDITHRFIALPKSHPDAAWDDLITDWRLLRISLPGVAPGRQLTVYDFFANTSDIRLLTTRHTLLDISLQEVNELNRSADFQQQLGMTAPTFQEVHQLTEGIDALVDAIYERRSIRAAKRKAGYFDSL